MPTVIAGKFEWDAEKNTGNVEKHGIRFEEAILIFQADFLEKDIYHPASGELRYMAIGRWHGKEIAVIYTMRGKRRRIISVRRARDDERKIPGN